MDIKRKKRGKKNDRMEMKIKDIFTLISIDFRISLPVYFFLLLASHSTFV